MFPFTWLRWRGLRLKILVWSFVPTAVALVAVGLVSFYAFQTTTRFLLIERNRELTRVLAAQLSRDLYDYPDILSDLTRTFNFAGQNAARQQAALTQAGNSLAVFDGGVLATDEHGIIVATQPERPDLIGQDWSGRSYFRLVLRSMQPSFSNVVQEGPGGTDAVVVSVPIIGSQGEFRGMASGMFVLGATNISTFYGNIVKLRIGESEEAHLSTYLVDERGEVLYHTDGERIGEDFSQIPAVSQLLDGNFEDQFSAQSPAGNSYRGGAGAMRARDAAGIDVIAYFASIPGTSWGLVSESSWSGLLGYYRPYLIAQTMLFVLGVIAPALLVGFGIRRLTGPIYELKKAVEDVSGGNFGRQVNVKTGDELEDLGLGFNHMSVQLSQSYAALKEREERLALVMQGTNDGIWDWNLQTGEIYYSPRWKSMLGYEDHEIANRFETWRDLIHPEDAARAVAAVNSHIESGETAFHLEHRLRHKNGEYRWILARGTLLRDENHRPLRMVGSHSDITKRRRAENELREAYETMEERVVERTKYLAALNNISALVNRSLDIEQTLKDALDKILDITGMQHGAAYRLEGIRGGEWLTPEETNSLELDHLFLNPLVYRELPEKAVIATGRIPLQGSGVEPFLDSEAPLVWEVDPGLPPTDLFSVFVKVGCEQIVSLPLKVKGRLIGVIQGGNCSRRDFSAEEFTLLSAIGQQVGVSAENARLHQAVQRTATLEERARLARELHDSVTQSLYSVTLLAEAAARLLSSGDSLMAAEHLQELRDAAQESLREMRLLVYELRPSALEKHGLADALRLRLEAVESRSGIKTNLLVEGTENILYETKSELYQIAQETLNNILKHSHAANVQVKLRFQKDSTTMEIKDDGVGFDPELAASSGGMGLAGLSERAEKVGGRFQVESAPGRGACIRIEVSAVSPEAIEP